MSKSKSVIQIVKSFYFRSEEGQRLIKEVYESINYRYGKITVDDLHIKCKLKRGR